MDNNSDKQPNKDRPDGSASSSSNVTVTRQKKREGCIGWDDQFMGFACLAQVRSKDPNRQVGACIVNENNRIVGTGYNGMPNGCSDDEFPWGRDRESGLGNNKHYFVCHAELNAIMNSNSAALKGSTMYVGLFPCNECAKLIIQSGIKKVIYLSDDKAETLSVMASKKMFQAAGVVFVQHIPPAPITINFVDQGKKE